MRSRKVIIVLLSCLMIFIALFAERIMVLAMRQDMETVGNIDSLMNVNKVMTDSLKRLQLRMNILDADPASGFIRLKDQSKLNGLTLEYSGLGQWMNERSHLNDREYSIMYTSTFKETMVMIDRIERSREMKKLHAFVIEPGEDELRTTLFLKDE